MNNKPVFSIPIIIFLSILSLVFLGVVTVIIYMVMHPGISRTPDNTQESAVVTKSKDIANKRSEAMALNDQGLDYFDDNDYTNAEVAFRKAIEVDPDMANSYNNLGTVLSLMGKKEEALENYKKAILLYPQYANAYSNIGVYYRQKGDVVHAIDNFKKAISFDLNHFKSNMHLGDIYTIQGDYQSAESSYKKALESNQIDPQSIDAIRNQLEYLLRLTSGK